MKVKHDFHIHTNLSLCAREDATVENYMQAAEKHGLEKIGFADHFWDSSIEIGHGFYDIQNYNHVQQIKPLLEQMRSDKIKTYFGAEVEYDPKHRGVAITEAVAEQFDFLIVPNSHTHFMMPKDCYEPYQKHVDFMVQAYEDTINSNVSRYITAMAHPFDAVCCPYDYNILINLVSDDCYKRLFYRTAEKEIAVEINMGAYRLFTPDEIEQSSKIRMFRLAKECGCKFIFGSDAHSADGQEGYEKSSILMELLELKEKDIADIAL